MSHEIKLPFGEEEILTRFHAAHEISHPILDEEDSAGQQVAEFIKALDLDKLVGASLMVRSFFTFARTPDMPPGMHMIFHRPFILIGELNDYSNLVDEKVPVKTLTADIVNAEVIDVPQEAVDKFRLLRFEIPLLAIESCILAEAA